MAVKRAKRRVAKKRTGGEHHLAGAHAPGATPLMPDDLIGLNLPATTHGELNALEAENILQGWRWAVRSTKSTARKMLTEAYVRELHKRMFGEVWQWAGEHRKRELNIGIHPSEIAARLKVVLDDAQYWLDQATYEPEEIAIRLHHRIVQVHPFRNGNGRLSRMIVDLLLVKHFRQERLPWGGNTLGRSDPRRDEYLDAVRNADASDYGPLLSFCRSS